jgi:hypothetical protein
MGFRYRKACQVTLNRAVGEDGRGRELLIRKDLVPFVKPEMAPANPAGAGYSLA